MSIPGRNSFLKNAVFILAAQVVIANAAMSQPTRSPHTATVNRARGFLHEIQNGWTSPTLPILTRILADSRSYDRLISDLLESEVPGNFDEDVVATRQKGLTRAAKLFDSMPNQLNEKEAALLYLYLSHVGLSATKDFVLSFERILKANGDENAHELANARFYVSYNDSKGRTQSKQMTLREAFLLPKTSELKSVFPVSETTRDVIGVFFPLFESRRTPSLELEILDLRRTFKGGQIHQTNHQSPSNDASTPLNVNTAEAHSFNRFKELVSQWNAKSDTRIQLTLTTRGAPTYIQEFLEANRPTFIFRLSVEANAKDANDATNPSVLKSEGELFKMFCRQRGFDLVEALPEQLIEGF